MENKSGKEYIQIIKVLYYHPDYLTYMTNISCEMLGWMKHKLESRLLGEVSITCYADDITLMTESKEQLKSLLMKVKEDSEKGETVTDFIFWGLQNHCRLWLCP